MSGEVNAGAAAPAHSRFGASGAERWLECAGSVTAQEPFPNETSEYAQEGTDLHSLSALCLESGQDAVEFVDRKLGETEIDEEHADAVQLYLDTIRADQKERGGKLLVEVKFNLAWLHPELWGTADCVRLGRDNVLTVYDAKYGRGKLVEVVLPNGRKNPQLSYYGLGALEALRRLVDQFNVHRIELVVVQPRAQHRDGRVRRVMTSHAELLDLSADLVDAINKALGPNPPFKAGDWCKFCRAAGACKALRDFAYEAAQLAFDDGGTVTSARDPVNMDAAELAQALNAVDVVDAWAKAVRGHATQLANSGAIIPGFKLADRRATRKWTDETKAASELQLVYGLDADAIFKQKLLSPAQVEKKLKPAERPALASLYDKKSSGTVLVRADDARPEVQAEAQRVFDDADTQSPPTEW